jgi:protein tyrosine phosphatase
MPQPYGLDDSASGTDVAKPLNSDNSPLYRHILPDELASLMQLALEIQFDKPEATLVNSTLLIIDTRPESQHCRQAILGSTNLTVPSTLLKRPSFGIDKILSSLKTEEGRRAFEDLESKTHIVIYDAFAERISAEGAIALLIQKFEKSGTKATLLWLQGGFSAFSPLYPNLIVTGEVLPELPPDAFSSLSLMTPGGTKAHLTLHETSPTSHSLFSKGGKSAYATHVETSAAELQQLTILHGARVPDDAPQFLKDLCNEPDVKKALQIRFKQVEAGEHRRMAACMKAKTPNDEYSISVGIEMGYKNRYSNVWPFNYNRVKLQSAECDYINASHIKVAKRDYICAQGPTTQTFYDFWIMVRENVSHIVVMLTPEEDHGRKQCHRYWPIDDVPLEFQGLSVHYKGEHVVAPHIVGRILDVMHQGQTHRVYQLQYLSWPDHGVPDTADDVIGLWEVVDELRSTLPTPGPLVVHCSAGCGRTGTFCTMDYLFSKYYPRKGFEKRVEDDTQDDVLNVVNQLRRQRLLMVQTFSQFAFCYETLLKRAQKPDGNGDSNVRLLLD